MFDKKDEVQWLIVGIVTVILGLVMSLGWLYAAVKIIKTVWGS